MSRTRTMRQNRAGKIASVSSASPQNHHRRNRRKKRSGSVIAEASSASVATQKVPSQPIVPGKTTSVSLEDARELAAWLRHERNAKMVGEFITIQPASGNPYGDRGDKTSTATTTEMAEFTLSKNVEGGDVILSIPQDNCVTAVDAKEHPIVAPLIEEKPELVQLALWLCCEKAKAKGSEWWPYLKTLNGNPNSVLRFTEEEFKELLKGTSIDKEARQRRDSAKEEYEALRAAIAEDPGKYPLDVYAFLTESAFIDALDIVCARAQWLNSANCYAMVPLMDAIPICGAPPPVSPEDPSFARFYEIRDIKTGLTAVRCGYADYDVDSASVVLCANTRASAGSKILQIDHSVRNNSELYLSFGDVDDQHPGDYEYWPTELSENDPLYAAKKSVLEAQGFADKGQTFPVYKDRMPREFLSYLRFARVTNSEELFAVSFTEDKVVSPMNEYETLQLLMADCRDRMSAYDTNEEDELLLQKRDDVSLKIRNASRLRRCEKELVGEMMNAVRRRLAPIRGIPTKQGMEDPNSDLLEIFDAIESIPNAPKKAFENFQKWARGDYEDENRRPKGGGGGCG
ncbi:predicted protein [Bathycoccus prasinos]|uniref:Rubisco LSMT substrate-binding domain-containing protein n=1 Tax=Bathycoccus prasinos TaxID=41875 RepID=K8F213_9CHLO|nr:predicted protein [Bathycoccus prasinos]CCO66102.1 predicted protein [Bathycoccus prasinos]|eukprot:XP_007512014.1 predicted protein [Bathycoccus prasinos]